LRTGLSEEDSAGGHSSVRPTSAASQPLLNRTLSDHISEHQPAHPSTDLPLPPAPDAVSSHEALQKHRQNNLSAVANSGLEPSSVGHGKARSSTPQAPSAGLDPAPPRESPSPVFQKVASRERELLERHPVLSEATVGPPVCLHTNGVAGPVAHPKGHRGGAGGTHAGMAATGQKLLEAWERHEEHLKERQLFFE